MASTDPSAAGRGPGSRTLIVVLLVAAAVVALLPAAIARSRRVQIMRADLSEVLTECREAYERAPTAADTLLVDSLRPALHGRQRPGDPACGSYRRRNMTNGRSE